MALEVLDNTLRRVAELIAADRFEELETDTIEFKAVPSTGAEWRQVHQSACAFLNTRGGIIILGVKEEGTGPSRRYRHTGWRPDAEPNIREISQQFTDEHGTRLHIDYAFPAPVFRDFLNGRVAVALVDELPADVKFAFFRREAYKRVLTGDQRISDAEIAVQREFRESARLARELEPVEGIGIENFDLDKLNDYITALNRPVRIETIKADLESARPFLERKCFIKDGIATTLGVLVCGRHPNDILGFRCHVHGYVDVPQEIARDKQDFIDNILPLMESSFSYLLRNIQVGVSVERGGTSQPQYPEELLRETVNNALAHRDYSINRQVVLVVKPGKYIAIKNPGTFSSRLLIEDINSPIPLRRILPEAKPRNPKLADVLRVFRKWEGRGIGMATMVNLALQNDIDLPYYIFGTEDVTLHLCTGRLLDDRMKAIFQSFDGYIADKLGGGELTESQQLVVSYLIKAEWANEAGRYTILLTPDNNHFNELAALERSGLIERHDRSTATHPIYVANREFLRRDYFAELQEMFGVMFDSMNTLSKDVLSVVYRFNQYSRAKEASARQVSIDLWAAKGIEGDIKAFDSFNRKVRKIFNDLVRDGLLARNPKTKKYVLSKNAGNGVLKLPTGRS